MKQISLWLYRYSSGWAALAGLGVFLLFTALVLPAQAKQAEAISGGAGSPDTSFFYTPEMLYQMAEAYGPSGRAAYLRARFTFDLVFPLVYGFFLTTSLSWALKRSLPPESRLRLANLLPLLAVGLDYLENLSAALVMARFPASTPVVDWLAPVFTLLKWIGVGGSFLLLAVGLIKRR